MPKPHLPRRRRARYIEDAREEGAVMDLGTTAKLNNGADIPILGFGVFLSEPGAVTEQAVRWALEIGYRHIDTASLYKNETDVGRAVRESGIPREKIFITTKLWNTDQGYQGTLKAFDESRKRLGMDVVDLYLIHWPVAGKTADTWRAMEKLYAEGKVRAIGVSNFLQHHIEELKAAASVPPAVNQVEFHPFLVQRDLLEYDRKNGICHEAWSPLARSKALDNPVIVNIAEKYDRSPSQIILRWDIQLGVVTIPKSVHRERILENSRVFDFSLEKTDMDRLMALDTGSRIGPHPDRRDF